MRRLTGISLSAVGLIAMVIAPVVAATHSGQVDLANSDRGTANETLVSLRGQFSDSFYNGSGGLNS